MGNGITRAAAALFWCLANDEIHLSRAHGKTGKIGAAFARLFERMSTQNVCVCVCACAMANVVHAHLLLLLLAGWFTGIITSE